MLTQNKLKKILHYNPKTGIFVWLISCGTVSKLTIAGRIDSKGYGVIKIDRKQYFSHRLAWLYVYGVFPINQIDHTNHIRNDNRIANLRDVPQIQNLKNSNMSRVNSSGTTGVYWHKSTKKWMAYITDNYKLIYIGVYKNKIDAIKARKKKERKYDYHPNHGSLIT